jgi:hypothetical protein
MAVNINLISSVGIRSSKPFTEYPSPSVFIETINDLEGKSYVQRSLAAGSLSVSSLSPFIIQGKNTTSTQQVLTFTNNGTRDLTINNIYFTSVYSSSYGSSEGVLEVQPKVTTGTGWSIVSNEIDGKTIKTMLIPGESRQLNLAYYATAESDPSRVYNNYIGVEIDNSTPNIGGQSLRLFTVQTISDIFNFRLTPFTITNTSTISNEVSQYNVSIIPLTPTTSTLSVSIVGTGYYLTD